MFKELSSLCDRQDSCLEETVAWLKSLPQSKLNDFLRGADKSCELLLDLGADPCSSNESGCTPLHIASELDLVNAVKLLLSRGANINAKDCEGEAPLHWLCEGNGIKSLHLLLDAGADVHAVTTKGKMPLHLAVKATLDGHLQQEETENLIEALLASGSNPNARDEKGYTPLHHTSTVSIAKILLNYGADLNARAGDGTTPLHTIQVKEVVEFLLRKGTRVSVLSTPRGSSPLHQACCDGNLEKVKLLLAGGASIQERASRYGTPIHYAALGGHVHMIEFLLEEGTDINAIDLHQTPLSLAAQKGHKEASLYLLEKGALVNLEGVRTTVLHEAMRGENLEIVKAVVEQGADLRAKDNNGATPLHNCYSAGCVEYLIDQGAEIDVQDNHGETPLQLACQLEWIDEVKLLIEKGADVHVQTLKNRTPLHDACYYQNFKVAHLLLNKGADPTVSDYKKKTAMHELFDEPASSVSEYVFLLGLIKFMIAKGADVNAMDEAGLTPLDGAVQVGHLHAVELLLNQGAKANDATIALAIEEAQFPIIDLLLERGVTPTESTKKSLSLWRSACG